MEIRVVDKTKTVCQGSLFDEDTLIASGEKLSFEIDGIEKPFMPSSSSRGEFNQAVLNGLGLQPIFDFGAKEEAVTFQVVKTFDRLEPLETCSDYYSLLIKRKALSMLQTFLLDVISQREEDAKVRFVNSIACNRILRMSRKEDPLAMVTYLIENLVPFAGNGFSNRNLQRNLARTITREYERKELMVGEGDQHQVASAVRSRLANADSKAPVNSHVRSDLQSLYRSYGPSLRAEKLLDINWDVIRSPADVSALVNMVVELSSQFDVDDDESIACRKHLVNAYILVQRECESQLQSNRDTQFAVLVQNTLDSFNSNEIFHWSDHERSGVEVDFNSVLKGREVSAPSYSL